MPQLLVGEELDHSSIASRGLNSDAGDGRESPSPSSSGGMRPPPIPSSEEDEAADSLLSRAWTMEWRRSTAWGRGGRGGRR